MSNAKLSASILPELLAVCQLEPNASIPDWADGDGFCSITRTKDELSVICMQERVPDGIKCERGLRAIKVEGPVPIEVSGVMSSLVKPIADAGVSIFAIATYDTDYVLVAQEKLDFATQVLSNNFNFK